MFYVLCDEECEGVDDVGVLVDFGVVVLFVVDDVVVLEFCGWVVYVE